MERRRLQAVELFAQGVKQAEVARRLGASRQSVSRWHRSWRCGGPEALKAAGRAGRKPKLDSEGLKRLDAELRKGPRAHGYASDLWTLKRMAAVIGRLTGVRYHPGHVWKVLGAMGWSLQRPASRARERNPEGVRQWVSKRWPRIKKTPDG